MTGSLQSKNGKYYAVINFKDKDGKRIQKWINLDLDVKNNKRKAEQKLNELLLEYEKKQFSVESGQLFTVFMENWLDVIKPTVKITTWNGYKKHLEKHIKPYFDKLGVTLAELTPMHIQKYYSDKMNEGLSASSVKRHHANIHKALNYAMKLELIPYNPSDRVTLPKRQRYIGKYYNEEQLKHLIDVSRGTPIESVVFLTANYGFRRSEVLGLKWSAVDFTGNTVTVRHTAVSNNGKTLYDDTTKTKASHRTLPLTASVRKYLLRLKEHQAELKELMGDCYCDSEYICCYEDGRPMRPDFVTRSFANLLEKNDLPKIRFHDLRHSAASVLINSGFNLKEVQDWLGHSDVATTGNIYSHLQYDSKLNMAEKFNGIFWSEKENEQTEDGESVNGGEDDTDDDEGNVLEKC